MIKPAKQTPRIMHSPLTDNYYIVTKYKEKTAPNGNHYIVADIKYDCTDQIKKIIQQAIDDFTHNI